MHVLAIIAGVVVAGLVARGLFRLMFDDSSEFWECVRYYFTPDLWSLIRGELFDDWVKSMKLGLFVVATGGSGALTYIMIERIS
jgi:hypothetical protein